MSYSLPRNVAIIMDGNRRWALKRGRPTSFGHKEGTKTLKKIVNFCSELNIEELTVFAFSTENQKRSAKEVQTLFFLAEWFLTSEIAELNKNNIKLVIVGNREINNKKLVKLFNYAEKLTLKNTGLQLNIAFNYGGKSDIISSFKKLFTKLQKAELSIDKIDDNEIYKNLQSSKVRDIDLLIRTGGEKRISNFMPWQLSYSEIYFSKILWPDFDKEELISALDFFSERERRYGKLNSKV